MRQDDRHLRKIHRDIVDEHRVAVFETDAAATGQTGADDAMPRVEQHRQFRLRDSRTPSAPRDGSMLANAIAMSAFSAANSTTLSLGTIGRPVSFSSTGKTTQPIFRERKYSASDGQSRATPVDPKYFCACLSA